MPLQLQSRLLRVLENHEVARLGAARARKIDFQVICATHCDIESLMSSGTFRRDLYFRIAGYQIELAPLRARSDFGALARMLIDQISKGQRRLSDPAMNILSGYDWPGNVRELKHALTLANALAAEGRDLEAADFDFLAAKGRGPAATSHSRAISEIEADRIRKALIGTGRDIDEMTRQLGMSRATLYRRLKELGLSVSRPGH
jgi:transcriptional regulator of acetoin/glycerol metabolism